MFVVERRKRKGRIENLEDIRTNGRRNVRKRDNEGDEGVSEEGEEGGGEREEELREEEEKVFEVPSLLEVENALLFCFCLPFLFFFFSSFWVFPIFGERFVRKESTNEVDERETEFMVERGREKEEDLRNKES